MSVSGHGQDEEHRDGGMGVAKVRETQRHLECQKMRIQLYKNLVPRKLDKDRNAAITEFPEPKRSDN